MGDLGTDKCRNMTVSNFDHEIVRSAIGLSQFDHCQGCQRYILMRYILLRYIQIAPLGFAPSSSGLAAASNVSAVRRPRPWHLSTHHTYELHSHVHEQSPLQ